MINEVGELICEATSPFMGAIKGDVPTARARTLAALVLVARCSVRDAERALDEALAGRDAQWANPDWNAVAYWVGQAGQFVKHAPVRRRFVLVPADGKPSNVISCAFERDAESRFTGGILRARVLSVKQVAYRKRERTMKAKERRDG